MKQILFIISILGLASCNSRYKMWDISKFNIVPDALADDEEIKLLYSSQGPGNNDDMGYFIHIVAVSQKNGDTVNILTPVNNGFTAEDSTKTFNYFGPENIATEHMVLNGDTSKKGTEADSYVSKKLKNIFKVARDPKYDYIADNKYPAVIGTIGTFTKNNN